MSTYAASRVLGIMIQSLHLLYSGSDLLKILTLVLFTVSGVLGIDIDIGDNLSPESVSLSATGRGPALILRALWVVSMVTYGRAKMINHPASFQILASGVWIAHQMFFIVH